MEQLGRRPQQRVCMRASTVIKVSDTISRLKVGTRMARNLRGRHPLATECTSRVRVKVKGDFFFFFQRVDYVNVCSRGGGGGGGGEGFCLLNVFLLFPSAEIEHFRKPLCGSF